jgi:hypothetical protein
MAYRQTVESWSMAGCGKCENYGEIKWEGED